MFAAVLPIAPNDSRREGEVSRTIAELITHDLRVDAQTPVGRVIKMFEKNPDFDAVAVIGGKHPQMVSRPRFFRELGKRFGYALLEKQPVSSIAEDGSTAEASADPRRICHRSRLRANPSTSARISGPSVFCSTRCSRASAPSRATTFRKHSRPS